MSSINHAFSLSTADPAEEWRRLVSDAAYLLAQRRGFIPGSEIDDWLAAEAQIEFELSRKKLANAE